MDQFLERMRRIGMSENEAKVYQVLFQLKIATPREIYELCSVPRNKVYECLSSLQDRGFIHSSPTTPVRYYVQDIIKTFDCLKKKSQQALEEAQEYLLTLEAGIPQERILLQAHELTSAWAVENRTRMLLKQAKKELIILCHDPACLRDYIPDLRVFARTARQERKISLYLVTGTDADAAGIPVPCYVAKKSLNDLMNPTPPVELGLPDGHVVTPKLAILSDRTEWLVIAEVNGKPGGMYFFGGLTVKMLSQHILENIRSSEKPEEETASAEPQRTS